MRRLLLALVLTVATVACGGDKATGPSSVTGTWTLHTVGGGNLPYTVLQVGADKIEIMSGTVSLNGDKTFTLHFDVRTTESGTVTTEPEDDPGTWSQTGTSITFTFPDGGQVTGSVSGSTLTVIDGNLAFVYGR